MSRDDQGVIPPEVRIVIPDVAYPAVCLWEMNVPKERRLQIINGSDFPLKEVLKGLGIDDTALEPSFGICDPDEIRRRQALVRFFVERPRYAEFIRDMRVSKELPEDPEGFLRFVDPRQAHNPYWAAVNSVISMLDEDDSLPTQLRELREALRATLPLEGTERQLTDIIADRISSVAVIEGLISFTIDQRGEEPFMVEGQEDGVTYPVAYLNRDEDDVCKVWGHQMYSFALSAYRDIKYPGWAYGRWNPLRWIGIVFLVRAGIDLRNYVERAKAYDPMTITKPSEALVDDIRSAVLEKLNRVRWSERQIENGRVRVYFRYSQHGLRIQAYGLEVSGGHSSTEYFEAGEFPGYPRAIQAAIEERRKQYVAEVERSANLTRSGSIRAGVESQIHGFFSHLEAVPSSGTDKEHQWFAISNLYWHPALRPAVEAARRHRSYFLSQLCLLKEVARIALAYRETAAKFKVDICFPKILGDGEHVVAFDSVLPAHLLFLDKVKPLPITGLQPLNGQMLGLTGYHGEGKTVTELTVATDIYLTQSGLPILGSGFQLNPKGILGLVFIENRSGGSTCELLLTKMRAVLEGIKGHRPNEVVVILDEVGTGTQEVAGLQLGRDVLATLAGLGVSVIFSTQITDLAHHAVENLGAFCYQFGPNHQMTPGIGDGGMARLRKRVGIDPLLVHG